MFHADAITAITASDRMPDALEGKRTHIGPSPVDAATACGSAGCVGRPRRHGPGDADTHLRHDPSRHGGLHRALARLRAGRAAVHLLPLHLTRSLCARWLVEAEVGSARAQADATRVRAGGGDQLTRRKAKRERMRERSGSETGARQTSKGERREARGKNEARSWWSRLSRIAERNSYIAESTARQTCQDCIDGPKEAFRARNASGWNRRNRPSVPRNQKSVQAKFVRSKHMRMRSLPGLVGQKEMRFRQERGFENRCNPPQPLKVEPPWPYWPYVA